MTSRTDRGASTFPWRSCAVVFFVALAVRLFLLTLLPSDWIRPNGDWEIEGIAISLVTEGRFANPYAVPTGLTTHLPPVPPLMLALMIKIFGLTTAAGLAAWVFRFVLQAAILGLLPWIGERTGLGWRAGLVGGLAGALWPQVEAHGGNFAALLLGLLAVAMARRWDSASTAPADGKPPVGPSARSSLLLGAGFGIAFHAQPALLGVLLGYLLFEVAWLRHAGRWRSAMLVALGALVICLPWGIRNYRAFDSVIFVRGNFGLELRMGNHDGATANIDDPHFNHWPPHPRTHREEAVRVREMGEAAYMQASRREALDWIRDHPGEFLRLTSARIRHFWIGPLDHPLMSLAFISLTGLALIGAGLVLRRLPASSAGALLIPLLTFPPVYYLVPWQQRYRLPIEWILFLLAGFAVCSIVGAGRVGTVNESGTLGNGKISS